MNKILRSMLFVPANNWRMILSAASGRQDAIILDLEDACPMGDKETGRIFARDSLPMFEKQGHEIYVRVNSLNTDLTAEDLSFMVEENLTGIMLAKAESGEDITSMDRLLEDEEEKKELEDKLSIIPLIESPEGVLKVSEIISASERVCAIGLGAGDFLREMGEGFATTRLDAEKYFPAILWPRSSISMTARVAGIPAIDTPFFGSIIDIEGLKRDSQVAKLLGFQGKMVVHPRQIAPVNKIFSPSEEDVNYARKVAEAFEEAQTRGLGATTFRGRMIDYATYKMANELIAKAEMIKREGERKEEREH